jgi:hypothetical protein
MANFLGGLGLGLVAGVLVGVIVMGALVFSARRPPS